MTSVLWSYNEMRGIEEQKTRKIIGRSRQLCWVLQYYSGEIWTHVPVSKAHDERFLRLLHGSNIVVYSVWRLVYSFWKCTVFLHYPLTKYLWKDDVIVFPWLPHQYMGEGYGLCLWQKSPAVRTMECPSCTQVQCCLFILVDTLSSKMHSPHSCALSILNYKMMMLEVLFHQGVATMAFLICCSTLED